jgi:hypothetical protein
MNTSIVYTSVYFKRKNPARRRKLQRGGGKGPRSKVKGQRGEGRGNVE